MSATTLDDVSLIRERMRRLRGRLEDRATQLATCTEELLDWKTYAKRHPVALVSAGLIAGLIAAPAVKTRNTKPTSAGAGQEVPSRLAAGDAVTGASERRIGFFSGFLHETVSPMLKEFLWSYARGTAAVHLDSLLRSLNAGQTESSRAATERPQKVSS